MKYSLLLFFLFSFYFSNAQSGKSRIKLGSQITRTPYLLKLGFGYHGEYEFTFGNRYSAQIGIGQAKGNEKNDFRLKGNSNGIRYDNVFFYTNREGVNYLEVSILSRLFKNNGRNHFKIGSGFTLQSVWVEYAENINFVGGIVQDIVEKRKTINIGVANLIIQNDFYLTSNFFINAKVIIKMPFYFLENSSFQRYVPNKNSSGGKTRFADLHITGTLIIGAGYRF